MSVDHSSCIAELKAGMAPYEVTVSEAPPLVLGQFTTEPFTCPHGIKLWMEPTGDEIARMVAWDQEHSRGTN